MKNLVLVLLFSGVLAGCNPPPQNKVVEKELLLNTPPEFTEAEKSQSLKAVQVFFDTCPLLKEVSDDIESINIDNSYWGFGKKFDFKNTVNLKLTFKERPADIRLVEARAFHQTCYYQMGSGNWAGWVTTKTACAKVCDVPKDNDDVAYKPDERFNFLDKP